MIVWELEEIGQITSTTFYDGERDNIMNIGKHSENFLQVIKILSSHFVFLNNRARHISHVPFDEAKHGNWLITLLKLM